MAIMLEAQGGTQPYLGTGEGIMEGNLVILYVLLTCRWDPAPP